MTTLFQKEKFSDEKYDIILLIGQSNAEGYGIGPVEDEYVPCESIMQFTDSYPVMYRLNAEGVDELDVPEETVYRITPMAENTRKGAGKLGCLAISFANEYQKAFGSGSEKKTLVVKAAIGGTGFMREQWTPDGVLYKGALEMTDMALGLNSENRLAAILWHQGESEAIDGKGKGYDYLYSFYVNSLTRLMTDLEDKYGKIPFIAGGYCEDWIPRFAEESAAIDDATRAVIEKFDLAGYVATEGLGSNDRIVKGKYLDDVHFNRPALYELGRRYFELYRELTRK